MRLHFYSKARKTAVALAATALLLGLALKARADSPPQHIINGLSYPTSAQRFFEEGQRQLNQEIQNLSKQERLSAEKLLQISDEILDPQKPLPTNSR